MMRMNKKLQTCALALAACACCAAEECQPLTYANPIDLLYRVRPEENMRFREGADPEIVLHADKYWLFASKCGGYYVSDDMANWRHVATDDLPLEEYAPTVVEIDGTLYFSSRGATVWRAVDPLAGKWEKVPGWIPSVDSALFLDDDGRLYDYEGGTSQSRQPIRVCEIDRKTMRPVAGEKPVPCFTADRSRFGYEARGHNNEIVAFEERPGCLEGAHMIKRDGKYYFQFAGPGTEFFSYSDTAFVGDTPKGPFVRQALNPFSLKNFGYAKGAGHGKTFRDRHGNFWHVTTCTYFGVDRRIVLFPVFFDRDGEMWCDTAFSDWPLAIPNRRCESPEGYHTGWMPLSDGKAATASSNGGAAKNASDGDARTRWEAAGAAGEWLQVDFGGLAEVRAVQACFGECNAYDAWRKPDAARRWRIEATADGTSWRTVVDASAATDANDHAYRAFAEPVQAKALRLVCVSLPADARFAVRDLRVFGSMAKPVPSVPADLAVVRDAADARHASLKWTAVPGAAGYLVRFGPTSEKMHLSWIVRGTAELDLRCLDAQLDYHWSVAAYNEAGFSSPSAPVKSAAPFRFPRATPESQGIPSAAVSALVDRLHAEGDMAHGYMLLRHGKVVAEGWWTPYGPDMRHALYSISKAFTSMAIGYAVEDRKMTLNDRVNWFFPEYVPTNQTEHAKELRVRDLMQMASGHKSDPLGHARVSDEPNWAKSFYEVPVVDPPGLFFRYMTGNSCMLAQIHRKVTGADDMIDYLRPRLFDKLEIADMHWERQPDGTVFGGSGFFLRTEDLAKVAQLLLQGGVWKGERLLPLWWVKQATSCQTPYGKVMDRVLALHVGAKDATGLPDASNDWQQGYGYQMWMGRHETFRLCGAYGQIGVVMPNEDLVFVVHAGGNGSNMLSVNALYDTILPVLSATSLPENPTALAALRSKSASLAITLPAGKGTPPDALKDALARTYEFPRNERGLVCARFDARKDVLEFENAFGRQKLAIGTGRWKTGLIATDRPSIRRTNDLPGDRQPVGAAGAWVSTDTYRLEICYLRMPHRLTVTMRFADGRLEMTFDCPLAGLKACKVVSK